MDDCVSVHTTLVQSPLRHVLAKQTRQGIAARINDFILAQCSTLLLLQLQQNVSGAYRYGNNGLPDTKPSRLKLRRINPGSINC